MTDGLASIVATLEKQKAAIDQALLALLEVTTQTQPASVPVPSVSSQKGYKLSAEARERMSQGQRKRYAHLHTVPEPATRVESNAPGRKGKKRTAAQRRRMAEGQRKRYASLRGDSEPAESPALKPVAPKRKISAEGIKRIIAATKKRWRLKRAADKAALEMAEAKKASRKKASRKKAAVPAMAAGTAV